LVGRIAGSAHRLLQAMVLRRDTISWYISGGCRTMKICRNPGWWQCDPVCVCFIWECSCRLSCRVPDTWCHPCSWPAQWPPRARLMISLILMTRGECKASCTTPYKVWRKPLLVLILFLGLSKSTMDIRALYNVYILLIFIRT
jgi:hypothetical protein